MKQTVVGRDPALFSRQQNPQWLGPGAVLLADSGNDRIVELHYNESTDTWEIVWRIRRVNGVSFDWPRDADRLSNGNTLITDTFNRRIVEINESGGAVWSRATRWKPYEADRLPGGETVGGPLYLNDTVTPDQREEGTPLLTRTYELVRITVPLPYWFSQWHLLVTLAALVSIVGGGLMRLAATD